MIENYVEFNFVLCLFTAALNSHTEIRHILHNFFFWLKIKQQLIYVYFLLVYLVIYFVKL